MRTIDSLGDIDGERVLVRVDFNVPIVDGKVGDDIRMRRAIPTLESLRDKGAKLILVSHLGRPKDREPEFSLAPVAEHAGKLLHTEVALAEDLDSVPDADVVMLENIRYEPGETKNDPEFAERLASLADYYVNDAFGTSHREHASTAGIVPLVKHSAAGLLFQSEVDTIRL
ncbi:MAG TPA: phosphoglycerate kinase, partial [Solirubrobacteraceae bacterium]|nr:phosphoglycerate kinase [Solirubrobacteraceae bacterium]